MANVNKVILIGNVTRDPEIKYTPKGTAVGEVSLAINRSIPAGEDGQRKEEVTYIDVTLWGRLAEVAGEYAKKGRPLYVEGRLQLDQWEDKKTGEKRSRLRVVGENIQLLGSGSGGQSSRQDDERGDSRSSRPASSQDRRPERDSRSRPQDSRPPAPRGGNEPEDDEIPF